MGKEKKRLCSKRQDCVVFVYVGWFSLTIEASAKGNIVIKLVG